MKKYLILQSIVLLLVTCLCATGQTIRFTDTTNKWQTEHTSWPDGYPNYSTKSFEADDTLVEWGGHQYTIIRSDDAWDEIWVREDTATRKVYLKVIRLLYYYDVRDTGEFLYMDFSLALGDSITMPIVTENTDLSTHTVTHVDSVLIGSQWHKHLRLATKNLGNPTIDYYEITEGIGPFSGPVLETRHTNEWGPYKLRCFSNNGIIPQPPFALNCFDPVGIDEQKVQQKSYTVYPNPASGKISVRSKAGYAQGTELILNDITGRRILASPLHGDTEIATAQLQSGLYLLHIMQKGILIQLEKIVLQ